MFDGAEQKTYAEMFRNSLVEAADFYCSDVPVDIFDLVISDIISDYSESEEYGVNYDFDGAGEYIEHTVEDIIRNELISIQSSLPQPIDPDGTLFDDINVYATGGYSLAQSYVESMYDYMRDDYNFVGVDNKTGCVDIVDYIFGV